METNITYEDLPQSYEDYLIQYRYSPNTIRVHTLRIKRFKSWLTNNGITANQLTYIIVLQYAKYLQEEKKYQRGSTNNELRAVKLYYDYLISDNQVVDNPAESLTIRGRRTKVITNLLSEEELEDLYYSYDIKHYDTFFKATKLRDKIILGLMIFQGIKTIELLQLQVEYLQLDKGKIDIPSTRRSNRRTLKLQPSQIIDMITYTNTTRDYLAKRPHTIHNEHLFFGSLDQLYSITHRIIKTLKKYNHKVTSHSQLRSSIIVNWLEKNNLRHVQYLAGHRYISSTEKYVQDDLENLHEIVNNFHPIA